MRKIYYQDSGYPIERNLVNLSFEHYRPEKKIVFIKVLNHLYYKVKGSNPLLSNLHWELFKRKDGLWHFFNGISLGKTPWVTTFETSLPRWGVDNEKFLEVGIKALARESCKKLIAISNCTKEFQSRYLAEEFPSYKEIINPKITVIHPPQQTLIDSFDEKKLVKDKLIFTIVGADFFRKGGKEVLKVFDRLLSQKLPVELNIISTLDYGDYASKATVEDLKDAKNIINKYPDKIHHYEKLPNPEVLLLLKNSDIGLLPTYADTYGYFVLEAQACGCPVISTNIRALPEINNSKCGWVIDVPKDRWGNGILDTVQRREQFSNIIREKLYDIITGIIENPYQIQNKGANSIERIRKEHYPQKVVQKLEKIYNKGLG